MVRMSAYESACRNLTDVRKKWLVTGVAGFIGSDLLEKLLTLGQEVVGIDNFSTGHASNLTAVRQIVGEKNWKLFKFVEGDIRSQDECHKVVKDVEIILHQAALGSVPRSIADPILTNSNNIDGFMNMLYASKEAGARRFVYAASSSTYGDHPGLPKIEDKIGKPLSPYAVTKVVNEMYADVFSKIYPIECIGLRYFNVYGRRQDPEGAYAAVIPAWVKAMLERNPVFINGDGETSRDFCYIDNVVQMNILAALTEKSGAINQVYNVAVGEKTSLNELFEKIKDELLKRGVKSVGAIEPVYRDYRAGDVRHSLADISKARNLLGYEPTHDFNSGLVEAVDWYHQNLV